jgi:hypothetical protein
VLTEAVQIPTEAAWTQPTAGSGNWPLSVLTTMAGIYHGAWQKCMLSQCLLNCMKKGRDNGGLASIRVLSVFRDSDKCRRNSLKPAQSSVPAKSDCRRQHRQGWNSNAKQWGGAEANTQHQVGILSLR